MAIVLAAVTAPDSYSPLVTIENIPCQRYIIDVANQAIYWQLQDSPGVWQENAETPMFPGSRVIQEPSSGIRIRAYVPAANLPAGQIQAVVTIRAITS